jgi:hypothetical protein
MSSLPTGATSIVKVTGTGFQSGLSVTTNIPGATVGTVTFVSATSIQVSITVPASDTAGNYTIIITNPDGGKVSSTKLDVT